MFLGYSLGRGGGGLVVVFEVLDVGDISKSGLDPGLRVRFGDVSVVLFLLDGVGMVVRCGKVR